MDISDKRLNKTILDGQEILCPTDEAWDELLQQPIIGKTTVFTQPYLAFALAFTKRHPEFVLAIYDVGSPILRQGKHGFFSLLYLYKMGTRWQRAEIRMVSCIFCGWKGFVAVVGERSLYWGIPHESEVLKLAPKIKYECPACRKPTHYRPLYIGKIIDDDELIPLFSNAMRAVGDKNTTT